MQFSTGKRLHNLRLQETMQLVHKQEELQWGCWTTLMNTIVESEGNCVITIHPNQCANLLIHATDALYQPRSNPQLMNQDGEQMSPRDPVIGFGEVHKTAVQGFTVCMSQLTGSLQHNSIVLNAIVCSKA